ncbi:hypothetical protein Pelo_18907 [Pelomyxa schiedti]|nr:hypothetical protein Pelo_18907 [Pelomyxa schiedti]
MTGRNLHLNLNLNQSQTLGHPQSQRQREIQQLRSPTETDGRGLQWWYAEHKTAIEYNRKQHNMPGGRRGHNALVIADR